MIEDALIPCWNGTLERAGMAKPLSTYQGRSSLWHVANRPNALEVGECQRVRRAAARRAGPIVVAQPLSETRVSAVMVLLRRGLSYRVIEKQFGVTVSQARRVAALMGRDAA